MTPTNTCTQSPKPDALRIEDLTRREFMFSALGAALLIACGDDEDDDLDPVAATSSPNFPRLVRHKYGETSIPAQPSRVVTIGLSDQDAVLALGLVPIGAEDWFGERPYGKWPWAAYLWGESPPEVVGERDEVDFEKVASLTPDLILCLYSGITEEQYWRLSQIAPTVAQPEGYDDYAAPWQEMTRLAGDALGKLEQAEGLIRDVAERFDRVRQEHPEFADQTAAVVDPFEPGNFAVFAPADPKSVFMTEMGFTVPQEIATEAGGDTAVVVSSERASLFDVDRLVFLTSDPSAEERLKTDPVYQQLEVVKAGNVIFLPYEDPPIGAALSFNTVLSIPYAIEQVLPLLTS